MLMLFSINIETRNKIVIGYLNVNKDNVWHDSSGDTEMHRTIL